MKTNGASQVPFLLFFETGSLSEVRLVVGSPSNRPVSASHSGEVTGT